MPATDTRSSTAFISLVASIGFSLISLLSCGQDASWDQAVKSVPCIRTTLNTISNDSLGMRRFYSRLRQLRNGTARRVNIVHIGDSHIQADHFSGTLRELFQSRFGNAGRGLVFPYQVAKTNSQRGLYSSSNVVWESKRCVFPNAPLPIGISGITIRSTASDSWLDLAVKGTESLGYGFSRLTIFHEKGHSQFEMKLTDSVNAVIGTPTPVEPLAVDFSVAYKFNQPRSDFRLSFNSKDTLQNNAIVYGMLLENDSAGILYNTIGVNGAEFKHFPLAAHFDEQLPALHADLIIVSLGTNDAFPLKFDSTAFLRSVELMIGNIRRNNPQADLLITTPPDSYRGRGRKRRRNTDMRIARNALVAYCHRTGTAYWDLYNIMGGLGSIWTWRQKGLVNNDLLHFQRRGYEIQGYLLYSAIIKCYDR